MSAAQTVAALRDRSRTVKFRIELAGSVYSYTSGGTWPAVTFTGGGAVVATFTDVASIIAVSAMRTTLDPTQAVIEVDPITITLLADRDAPRTMGDAGIVFGRLGRRSNSWSGDVVTTCGVADTTINVGTSPLGLSTPRLVYVGRECMVSTGTAGIGTAGDPWRFTGLTRGVGSTTATRHVVNAFSGGSPRAVSDEKTAWPGTRARLLVAAVFDDGTLSTPIELMRGFIRRPPSITGSVVTLELAPLTALLDVELGDPDEALRLSQTHHRFSKGRASIAQIAQVWREGDVIYTPIGATQSTAAGTKLYASTTEHENIFDVSLVTGHPRRGVVKVTSEGLPVEPTAYDAAHAYFVTPAGFPTATIPAAGADSRYRRVVNVDAGEVFEAVINGRDEDTAAAVVRWPKALTDAWATDIDVEDSQGATGALIRARLVLDDASGGSYIECQLNAASAGSAYHASGVHLVLGRRDAHLNDQRLADLKVWQSGAPLTAVFGPALLPPEALDMSDPATGAVVRDAFIPTMTNGEIGRLVLVPIVGASTAFYGIGEEGFIVQGTVAIPASGVLTLQITYEDLAGTEQTIEVEAVTATAVVDAVTATAVGTFLTLRDSDWRYFHVPSFCDRPGARPVEIRRIVQFRSVRSHVLLTQLLMSDVGEAVNGYADVQPYGAGLSLSEMDRGSFFGFDDPAGFEGWQLRFPAGTPLREVIEPVLLATGTHLVMKRDEAGSCRLTRVAAGVETAVDAIATITDAEIELPENSAEDEVIAAYTFLANYDNDDKPHRKARFVDANAVARTGSTRKLEVKLRGAVLPTGGDAELLPIFRALVGRLIQQFGEERRTWTVDVDCGTALLVDVGSTVIISSDHLQAYGTLPGIASLAARVTAAEIDLEAGRATLRLVHYGHTDAGWNEAAQVTSAPSTSSVVVSANAYSEVANPVTAAVQVDIDGFAVGDVVDAIPYGNDDSAVTGLTITDITGSTITFDGVHGLTTPWGWIEPSTYDASAAAHKALAYIADTAEHLGAADDGGFDVT